VGVFLLTVDFDIRTLIWTVLIGALVPVVASLATSRGGTVKFPLLRSSGGYWWFALSSNATQFEAPALRLVSTDYVVGLYGIASRVTGPLTILMTSLATILIPELAKRAGTPQYQRMRRLTLWLAWVYAGVLLLCAWPITLVVLHVLGSQYQEAGGLLIATVVAAGLSGVSQTYNSVLLAEGRPGRPAVILIIGAGVSVLSLIVFSATAGISFLWIAPLVTQLTVLALFWRAARQRLEVAGPASE